MPVMSGAYPMLTESWNDAILVNFFLKPGLVPQQQKLQSPDSVLLEYFLCSGLQFQSMHFCSPGVVNRKMNNGQISARVQKRTLVKVPLSQGQK